MGEKGLRPLDSDMGEEPNQSDSASFLKEVAKAIVAETDMTGHLSQRADF